MVWMWYLITQKKCFSFAVTFVANAKPVFSSTPSSIQITWWTDQNYTLPSATNSEWNSLYYRITIPSLPFTLTCSDPSTKNLTISGLAVNLETSYTGFTFEAWENSNFIYCTSFSFSIEVINTIPTVLNSMPNKSIIPYINSTISSTCPWFTDTQGDSLTINYTVTPSLTVMSMDSSLCQFAFAGMDNSQVCTSFNFSIFIFLLVC